MRIGINLLYLYPDAVGGTETYARGLISGLKEVDTKNHYYLFCTRESASTFNGSKNFKIIRLPVDARNRILRSLFEIFVFPFYLWKYKIDLVHSLGYSSPIFSPCPTIVNIYDLNWYYHPEDFDLFRRIGWQLFVKSSAYFCTRVVTSSFSSKKHLQEVLGISKKKIEVIYGGNPKMKQSYPKNHLKKLGINDKYIFTLTADVPHKNIMRLLVAYHKVLSTNRSHKLVIAGLKGTMLKKALIYIKKYLLESDIVILGWVTDRDLSTLYKYSTAFVFPSLHEGFGFAPLEALSIGTPLVSSDAFSLKEVIGDAGLLFGPRNTSEMANCILKVLDNPSLAQKLVKRGSRKIKEYSWEKSATKTLQIYNLVVKHG